MTVVLLLVGLLVFFIGVSHCLASTSQRDLEQAALLPFADDPAAARAATATTSSSTAPPPPGRWSRTPDGCASGWWSRSPSRHPCLRAVDSTPSRGESAFAGAAGFAAVPFPFI